MLSLLYPTYFILKTLISSTISAFYICKWAKKPFFNPEKYSHDYLLEKFNIINNVGKYVVLNYNIIYFGFSRHFLHEESLDIHVRIFQNIQFLFYLELLAYIYHRLSHEIPYLYKNSHYIHHRNIEVYPVDFLEFDWIDNIAQTLYINLPLVIVPMNMNDYAIIYYLYATGAFLIHSDIFTKEHVIHHRKFKYNYCLLIPIFDHLFFTYYYPETVEILENHENSTT